MGRGSNESTDFEINTDKHGNYKLPFKLSRSDVELIRPHLSKNLTNQSRNTIHIIDLLHKELSTKEICSRLKVGQIDIKLVCKKLSRHKNLHEFISVPNSSLLSKRPYIKKIIKPETDLHTIILNAYYSISQPKTSYYKDIAKHCQLAIKHVKQICKMHRLLDSPLPVDYNLNLRKKDIRIIETIADTTRHRVQSSNAHFILHLHKNHDINKSAKACNMNVHTAKSLLIGVIQDKHSLLNDREGIMRGQKKYFDTKKDREIAQIFNISLQSVQYWRRFFRRYKNGEKSLLVYGHQDDIPLTKIPKDLDKLIQSYMGTNPDRS